MSSDSSVITTVSARALASRRNGAKSRGPKTAAGKARAARNALKHGLCATKFVVFPEDAVRFHALEAALLAELAPVGALQAVLAQRVVSAAWRLMRADRLEAEVLDFRRYEDRDLGLALMRDGNGPRSIETVLRYRGAAMAEFQRALKTLQALQAAAGATAAQPAPARRRCGGRPLAARNEPTKARQINGLIHEPTTAPAASAPQPDVLDRSLPAAVPAPPPTTAPATTATRQGSPRQPLPAAPRRAPHDDADVDLAATRPTPRSPTRTKQTRETASGQRRGVQA